MSIFEKTWSNILTNEATLAKKLNTDTFTLGELGSLIECKIKENHALLAGAILGPYLVRNAVPTDLMELKINVIDKNGRQRAFMPMEFESIKLKQITWVDSDEDANCRVIFYDCKIFVIVLKTVQGWMELNAIFVSFDAVADENFETMNITRNPITEESTTSTNAIQQRATPNDNTKKFTCAKCTIGFTNAEKLRLHRNFYCKEIVQKSVDTAAIPIKNENFSALSSIDCLNGEIMENKEAVIPIPLTVNQQLNLQQSSTFSGSNVLSSEQQSHELSLLSNNLLSAAIEAGMSSIAVKSLNDTQSLMDNATTQNKFDSALFSNLFELTKAKLAQNVAILSTKYKNTNELSEIMPTIVTQLANTSSPILLPVAYHHAHDKPSTIQIIGAPQTIIPVAIHRSMPVDTVVRPLLIDTTQSQIMHIPTQVISIESSSTQKPSSSFHLPLAFQPTSSSSLSLSSTSTSPSSSQSTTTTTAATTATATTTTAMTTTQRNVTDSTQSRFNEIFPQLKANFLTSSSINCQQPVSTTVENNETGLMMKFEKEFGVYCSALPGSSSSTSSSPTTIAVNTLRTDTNENHQNLNKSFFQQKTKEETKDIKIIENLLPLDLSTNTKTKQSLNDKAQKNKCFVGAAFDKRNHIAVFKPDPVSIPSRKRCIQTKAMDCQTNRLSSDESVIHQQTDDVLHKNILSTSPSIMLSPSASKRQRLACDCGVSFSTEETLKGHKKYYCRNRIISDKDKLLLSTPTKNPLQCNLCEFRPLTHSQLSQHIRSVHAQIQSYICALCGYKGYSQRGIKSHLRVLHGQEFQQCQSTVVTSKGNTALPFTAAICRTTNLSDFVFYMTTNGGGAGVNSVKEKFNCIKCFNNFSTQELFCRHQCFVNESKPSANHLNNQLTA